MEGNGLMPRNRNVSFVALLKSAFSSVLQKEHLTVSLTEGKELKALLQKLNTQFQSVENALHRLREEGISLPETTFDLDTGTSEALSDMSKTIESLRQELPEALGALQKVVAEKDMVVNVPPFPEIKIPETQKIHGSVRVENPIDVSELKKITQRIEGVQKAIQSIYIPPQKEVVFPKMEMPHMPSSMTIKEGKAILEALKKLQTSIDKIKIEIPEIEFPSTVNVGNFPPQKIPQPVTHISINSLAGTVKTRSVTVGTTVTPLPGEVLSSRRSMIMYNNSDMVVEIGGSDMVFGEGIPISPGTFSPPFDAGEKMIVYGIVSSGTANVRVMEVSDLSTGR